MSENERTKKKFLYGRQTMHAARGNNNSYGFQTRVSFVNLGLRVWERSNPGFGFGFWSDVFGFTAKLVGLEMGEWVG